LFSIHFKAQTESLKINENASHIFEKTSINPDPSFKVNGKQYNFELSDEDKEGSGLILVFSNICEAFSLIFNDSV
jgi:hypothetical protein